MTKDLSLHGKASFIVAIVAGSLFILIGCSMEVTAWVYYFYYLSLGVFSTSLVPFIILGNFLWMGGGAILAAGIYGLVKAVRHNKAVLKLREC